MTNSPMLNLGQFAPSRTSFLLDCAPKPIVAGCVPGLCFALLEYDLSISVAVSELVFVAKIFSPWYLFSNNLAFSKNYASKSKHHYRRIVAKKGYPTSPRPPTPTPQHGARLFQGRLKSYLSLSCRIHFLRRYHSFH